MKLKPTLFASLFFWGGVCLCPAQFVEINRDGNDVILNWEAAGLLQYAPEATGPWMNDVGAASPHRVAFGGSRQFFRIFYPQGFQPQLEPPGLAFAEPNASPARVAHELAHVRQQRGSFLPEIGDEVLVHFGETRRTEVDLQIKGRALDFIWARTYRSRLGPDGAQGKRWDYSYNVHIQGGGPHVKVFDGRGHSAYFVQQPDGSYAADQFFREGRFDSNGVFRLMFADTGVWEFRALDGQPAAGKIARIADRNGNQLTFQYDPLGRLTNVTDTLNRNIQVAYNGSGFIESVTDFTGRQVRYEYYQDFEVGGSSGDLKSARSPIVTNTPTLNDFPLGKKTVYTYSEGFADERENHLLLAITDPKGQTSREYVYQHNSSDFAFLRCQAARLGHSSNVIQFHYVEQTPAPSNHFAVQQVIVNDRMGNVSEHFLDHGNRHVMLREFTGRAAPGQPTTETLNRPTNPLRTNDPPYFETTWEWNTDSLLELVVYPNGNSVSNVYESALSPAVPRRMRGNLRVQHELPGPLGGDQTTLVRSWTFDPRFGTDARYAAYGGFKGGVFVAVGDVNGDGLGDNHGFGFVTFTDPRGNTTHFAYDARGNCTNIVHRIPSIEEVFEYNSFGQLTARVFPDNGNGFRRRDAFFYYTGGPQAGYLQQLIADFDPNGFNQTTTYTYDLLGNLTSVTDPRGNDSLFTYNALDQLVHAESRQTSIPGGTPFRQMTDYFYDANDNLVRVCESHADELGRLDPGNAYITRLMEYDILDRLVRVCAESGSFIVPRNPPKLDCSGLPASEFITTEFEYDPNWNLSLVRLGEASEARQPANTIRTLYDERDLQFRTIRAEGDADQSSTQRDYDRNGNLTISYTGLESVPRITQFAYDGFNRRTTTIDAMGNVRFVLFNPNGSPVRARFEGETNDFVGSLGNVRLSEVTNVFDGMDRLTRRDVAFFDTATGLPLDDGQSTTLFSYSDSSQLLTRTDDNKNTALRGYDRLHRLLRSRDARSNEVFYAYDANSNPTNVSSVEKSDLGNPDQTFATRYEYDARNRLIRVLDNVSNSVQYAYDSRNNLVLRTDPLGVRTRYEYDGQTRQTTIVQDMNANGPHPADVADIILRTAWDDSSRLVSRTDDNTNVTTYAYDALNRRIREVLADGTGTTNSYDVHDNRLTRRDGNGNAVNYAYDLLNRTTNKTVVPGPGVSPDTTFERFGYDGLSRLVRAEDDDSLVELAHNSLGTVLRHRLNGKTTSAVYDGQGNVLSSTYPGGRVVQFNYDELNRIKSIPGVLTSFHYVGPGRIERLNYANGTQADYSYDGISGIPNSPGDFGVKQLTRTRHTLAGVGTVIDDRTATWDRRYSKTSHNDLRPGGPTQLHQFAYDAGDRLTRGLVMHPSLGTLRDTRYSLDGVGNRTSVTNLGGTDFYALDPTTPKPADFQVNQYTATPFDTRQYDENGNLRALNPGGRAERLLEFDYADRLVRFIDGDNNVTNQYAYDALGRRIRKAIIDPPALPQVTHYLYGAAQMGHANLWQMVEEQDSAGATLATYVHGAGLDEVLHMRRGGSDYFLHHDDLGNVMAASATSGAAVERYDYDDFGTPEFFNGAGAPLPQSAIGNAHLFTGRQFDDETGLYYFRKRYLDPAAGRFISRDPLGTSGDAANQGNASAYVGNNPWTHTDPMGLAKEVFVRSKPHVNVGTLGAASGSSAASSKPKEIVVVGSKLRMSNRLYVGNLSMNTSAAHSRKQSLYFPETMLQTIPGQAHGHMDFLKAVGDPATPVTGGAIPVYWHVINRGSSTASDTGTHEVGHWMGLHHIVGPSASHAGDVDGRDFLVWQRQFGQSASRGTHEVGHWLGLHHAADPSASGDGVVDAADYVLWRRSSQQASGRTSHPDFLWSPVRVSTANIEGYPDVAGLFRDTADGESGAASMDGAILVVDAGDGPMP